MAPAHCNGGRDGLGPSDAGVGGVESRRALGQQGEGGTTRDNSRTRPATVNRECRVVIKTKSVYDPVEDGDGERMLVTRYWPRGVSRERLSLTDRLPELAPSVGLLRDWKAGTISWAQYKSRYLAEMRGQTARIQELARRAESNTLTLLCIEREGDPTATGIC